MGQEALPPAPAPAPAAVAFTWEHEPLMPKPIWAPGMDAGVGMPGSPRKAAATVFLSWEHEQGITKQAFKAGGGGGVPESLRKAQAPKCRLSVPPQAGRPSTRGFSRAVRPEDDPFLAAYLACTKNSGDRGDDGGKKRTTGAGEPGKGQVRRFSWAGLRPGGLSCRRGHGAVVQSMVKLAKLPEMDPRDD